MYNAREKEGVGGTPPRSPLFLLSRVIFICVEYINAGWDMLSEREIETLGAILVKCVSCEPCAAPDIKQHPSVHLRPLLFSIFQPHTLSTENLVSPTKISLFFSHAKLHRRFELWNYFSIIRSARFFFRYWKNKIIPEIKAINLKKLNSNCPRIFQIFQMTIFFH